MVEVREVSKRFGSRLVLDRVTFNVADARVLVILGASGAGKSVLLRIMTGLLKPDTGGVSYDGVPIHYGAFADNQRILQQIGFVFQGGALFDSLDVFGNVALPLVENEWLDKRVVEQRVAMALEKVGMRGCAHFKPRELSGGMIKLVALARALVMNPRYLFLDEPTSGLDPIMRERICSLLGSLRGEEGKTEIVVTHDLEAVTAVADEVLMLREGKVLPLSQVRKEDYEQVRT